MSLPPEKVSELKQVIHNHLSQLDVHGQIRNVLSESLREKDVDEKNLGESGLLELLKERGIVDDIMKTLEFQGVDKNKKLTDPVKMEKSWVPEENRKCKTFPTTRFIVCIGLNTCQHPKMIYNFVLLCFSSY